MTLSHLVLTDIPEGLYQGPYFPEEGTALSAVIQFH